MSYSYTLPTTGHFDFVTCIRNEEFLSELLEATAKRTKVRDILKSTRRTDDKDIISVIKALEEYLPYIFSIEAALGNQFQLTEEILTCWRCTLIGTALRNQPRVKVASVYYELAFTLLTYAYALILRANTLVKNNDDKNINIAADNICRAAGVLQYIQKVVMATWVPNEKIPVDITNDVISALILLSIADAQTLRLACAKFVSPSLTTRICISTYEMLNSAWSQINSFSRRRELDDNLLRYINDNKTLARARVLKCLAIEAEIGEKIGEAVTCISEAMNLAKIAASSKIEILQIRAKEELAVIDAKYRELKRHNDRVTFQPEPLLSDIQAKMPSGRNLVQLKPFIKPALVFGDERHNSDSHVQEQEQELDKYAGQGAYY